MAGSVLVRNVNGVSVVVGLTTAAGTTVDVFSDPDLSTPVSLPVTITTDTEFYVAGTGGYLLSVTAAGTEIAGPLEVFLSQTGPVAFAVDSNMGNTDVDRLVANAGGGGGSEQFDPCWFQTLGDLNLVNNSFASPAWAPLTDGIDAGTDVVVDGDDDTLLSVVNTGVYQVSVISAPLTGSESDGVVVTCPFYVAHNDDSAGPASDIAMSSLHVGPNCRTGASLSFELPLTAGDTLNLNIEAKNTAHTAVLGEGYGTFVITRLS